MFYNTPHLSQQALDIRRLKAKIAELEEDKFIKKQSVPCSGKPLRYQKLVDTSR